MKNSAMGLAVLTMALTSTFQTRNLSEFRQINRLLTDSKNHDKMVRKLKRKQSQLNKKYK